MGHLKKILSLYLGLIFLCASSAQDPSYWQLTDEDGLPSMTVYNILQDNKGYMWIGTAGGICRFDGNGFVYFRHPDQIDDEIIYTGLDKFDGVWYSNISGQLFCIRDDSVNIPIKIADNLKLRFFKIHEDLIYIVSGTSPVVSDYTVVYKIKKNDITSNVEIKEKKKIKGVSILDIDFYREEKIFTTIDSNFRFKCFTTSDTISSGIGKENLLPKDAEEARIGGYGNAVPRIEFVNDNIFLFSVENHLYLIKRNKANKTYKKFINADGNINMATLEEDFLWLMPKNNGIEIIDIAEEDIPKNKGEFFEENTFNAIAKDAENNYWLATNDKGIFIMPAFDYQLFTSLNSPLQSNKIITLEVGPNERIIGGDDRGNLYYLMDGKFERKISLPNAGAITCILPHAYDQYLIGSDEDLISITYPDKIFYYNDNRAAFKALALDSIGTLWIGDYGSVVKVPLSRVYSRFGKRKDFDARIGEIVFEKRTYSLFVDYEGKVWIGTVSGLFIAENATVKPIEELGTIRISSITQCPLDSSIWIGTNGDGLLKFKGEKYIVQFKEENGFISNVCNDVAADKDGNIWIATNKGLVRHNLNSLAFDIVNKLDGLPTNEISTVAVTNEWIYVGTPKGLVTFKKDDIRSNSVPPPVYLKSLSIHDQDTTLQDAFELTYNQNSLMISYIGLNYRSRGDVKYLYRMNGLDTNWVSTTTDFARFAGLAPGNYRFEVLAVNEDGVTSKEPAAMEIRILPPWWETWWFRLSGGSFLIGIIWGGIHWRYRSIRKREKTERDLRDKIDELRQQALQTQMNPHFIFNSLNAIQHFLTSNDQENAMIYLARFARLIRLIFEQSKQKFITLEEEFEFLKIYLDLEKLRFKEKVNIKFEVAHDVEEQAPLIRIPPLLIQPIIENAFKHGLFHKEGQGHLQIHFCYEKNRLKCVIEDNGIGRVKAQELNNWRMKEHRSSGMVATMERLELLKGGYKEAGAFRDNFIVTDLYKDNGEAAGTKVEIIL